MSLLHKVSQVAKTAVDRSQLINTEFFQQGSSKELLFQWTCLIFVSLWDFFLNRSSDFEFQQKPLISCKCQKWLKRSILRKISKTKKGLTFLTMMSLLSLSLSLSFSHTHTHTLARTHVPNVTPKLSTSFTSFRKNLKIREMISFCLFLFWHSRSAKRISIQTKNLHSWYLWRRPLSLLTISF